MQFYSFSMEYYIITGASKGLGRGFAELLYEQGHSVVNLARTPGDFFADAAADERKSYHQVDLTRLNAPGFLLEHIFRQFENAPPTKVVLVQNAGSIHPLNPVGKLPEKELTQLVELNLLAPIRLTNSFIRLLEDNSFKKEVWMVSSGAAHRAVHGWSGYCSTKAGLLHFSRCVAQEQKEVTHPVRVLSIAPGVVDTGMQEDIREASEEQSQVVQRFRDLKANNELLSPRESAAAFLKIAQDPAAPAGEPLDIRSWNN